MCERVRVELLINLLQMAVTVHCRNVDHNLKGGRRQERLSVRNRKYRTQHLKTEINVNYLTFISYHAAITVRSAQKYLFTNYSQFTIRHFVFND